jgi:hypothetical protein
MEFSIEDKKDYVKFLENELKIEKEKTESLFTNYNSFNIMKDLVNMNLIIKN